MKDEAMRPITITLNGVRQTTHVAPDRLLIDFLRDDLGLTGTKFGCGTGDCGACAVLLDGLPVNACLIFAADCEGQTVETVEFLSEKPEGSIVVDAIVRNNGVQCGICTPGFVVTAIGSLESLGPDPTREDVEVALAGNLCRCTGYYGLIRGVQEAASEYAKRGAR
jgi:aerobic-type carbon monoxide dehydrogenase small subunit (CoxS/CutS family)